MAIPSRDSRYIEALVAVGILITLAGVVVPTLSPPVARAAPDVERDLAAIAAGLRRFIADTRTLPTGPGGAAVYHYLFTDGVQPDNNLFASGPGQHIDRLLLDEPADTADWRGPYLDRRPGPDPWGRAYLVNINGYFSSSERAVVLCAGPNGRVDSSATALTPGGDDQLIVLE